MVTFLQEMNFTAPTSLHFTTGFLCPIIVMFSTPSNITLEDNTRSVDMLTMALFVKLFLKGASGT